MLLLLERNETRRMGGTDTGATVTDKLVTAAVLGKVGSNHFWLDFDRVKGLAVVNSNDGANHFRDDDHVTKMGLDDLGLLMLGRLLSWPCSIS